MGFLRSACSAAFCGHEIRPASSALPQKSALQHHPAEKGCVPVLVLSVSEVERQNRCNRCCQMLPVYGEWFLLAISKVTTPRPQAAVSGTAKVLTFLDSFKTAKN